MASASSVNKPKGNSSGGPDDAHDVDNDAVSGATGTASSTLPTNSPATVSAATVPPQDLPKCQFCFIWRRKCDADRPCGSCRKTKSICRPPTEKDLKKFPKRTRHNVPEPEPQHKAKRRKRSKRTPLTGERRSKRISERTAGAPSTG